MRRRRELLRGTRAQKRVRLGLIVAGTLVVLGVVWIVVTALLARRQLDALQQRLGYVQQLISQGQLAQARTAAAPIAEMADRADLLTSGPAWWIAAHIPYLGDPAESARGQTEAADELGSNAVPQLLAVSEAINPDTLRVNGDTIRVAELAAAAPKLESADASMNRATALLAGLPANTWFGPLDAARSTLLSQLQVVDGYVAAAGRASRVIPEMFGADGKVRRYFIAMQNDAESRGTGGLPGAFAIARTQNGTLTFERFESDAALLPGSRGNIIKTGLDLGSEFNALYGSAQPTEVFNDSNVSPNFPYAARIWAAMWQKEYHQHIDGAVALDPTTLSYFLRSTGPAVVPNEGVVTADNVVSVVQRDAYAIFPDNNQRRSFLVALLKAASTKLTSGAGSAVQLAIDASRAAAERRLLVWSSDPATEQLLAQSTYAGDISSTADPGPLGAMIVNNAAAGKLDYYLQRSVDYSRTGCGATRDVNVSISLLNTAPASGLPSYVTTRLDPDRPKDVKPGDSRVTLDYYATGGAQLESVTVNGQRSVATTYSELGRRVFRFDVELPRGQEQDIQLHLTEPAGTGDPTMWLQPGVTPVSLRYFNQACG